MCVNKFGFQDPVNGKFWCIRDRAIVNAHSPDTVIDICRENKNEGADLLAYEYHGGRNQLWSFEYV